jgi:ankyrin repeat protein
MTRNPDFIGKPKASLQLKVRRDRPQEGKKRCSACKRLLDFSAFNGNSKRPDGMASKCAACVNRRRRELHAARSKSGERNTDFMAALVKRGDYSAVRNLRMMITAGNRDRLLALAVTDFKSAPKKPGHVKLVKLLIQRGAIPDFHLVCAATVGPHVDIMNTLLEAGAEQNLFTAAALGNVNMVRDMLSKDFTLAGKLSDEGLTALDYACRSELGKGSPACSEQLFCCAALLLKHRLQRIAKLDDGDTPLGLCASRGGNVKIAELLLADGWRPSVSTILAALGHGQRHGNGNYDVAARCLDSGVDINELIGDRTLLHAFAHQGDIVGTKWLVERGAKVNVRDGGNNTPLHKACQRNSTLKVVELLVKFGASLTAVNNDGQTPLDMAINNDKRAIAAYLRGVMARRSRR